VSFPLTTSNHQQQQQQTRPKEEEEEEGETKEGGKSQDMKGIVLVCLVVVWAVSTVLADVVSDSFIVWFKKNGGIVEGLTINEFPNMGRGFEALTTLEQGSMVLQIPKELQFCLEQMKYSGDKVVQKLFALISNGDMAIAAWILLEKYKGIDSFYAPYIDVLPAHVSSVLYFSEQDIEALQEPDFMEQIQQFQHTTSEEFTQLQRILQGDDSGLLKVLSDNLKQEDYVWACTIVNSRGLRFRGQVYLAPMADVFNYAPHPVPRLAQNGDHFLKHHILDPKNGTLTILADRSCDAGHQVLEDYGDNPNQIYLQYHGFVPSENPFNCIRIYAQNALVTFRKENVITDNKMRIITKLGLDRPFSDCINERGIISRSMGGLLAIASLNTPEVGSCLEVLSTSNPNYKDALQVCKVEKAISFLNKQNTNSNSELDTNESFFYSQLLKNFELTLHQEFSRAFRFDTTIEEDNFLLNSARLSAYEELAVRYRLSIKRLNSKLALVFGTKEYPIVSSQTATRNLANKELEISENESISQLENFDQNDKELPFALEAFNAWFNAANPRVNKLKAVTMPRYRIGTVTTEAVSAEETYLSVPVSLILDSEKAFLYSGVSPLLQALSMKYKTRDDFHELLFFLLYETFVQKENSNFWPYLRVLPSVKDVQIPLVWEQDQILRLLSPSLIAPTAVNYRSRTLKKFDFLSNLTEVRDFFGPLKDSEGGAIFSLERYLWATAILDSRSIWWSGRRHLVPMLDFINCEEHPDNVQRVHATTLDSTEKFAVTKAGTSYSAGEQLFENYGQPNHIYYLYHGFILEHNSHDCVSFEISFSEKEWQLLRSHQVNDYLEQLGINERNRVYSSCLSVPINTQMWNVVGLLTTDSLETNANGLKLPNKPTIESAKRMRKMLRDRFALYKDIKCENLDEQAKDQPWSHVAAKKFLCSEKSILNSLVNHVRDIQLELEHDEL
jgi:histone-lysine N-methyltransferase SETD3